MLVVPIGGGGLDRRQRDCGARDEPAIEIIGVEAALYPSMRNAVTAADDPCGGPTLAEGIAVKNVGALTLPVVRELVSDIVLVDEAHIERAVNAYLTLQKTMAEGAGAAGLAAMLAAAGAICRPQGRADPVRRQYRSAHPRLDHGARTGARGAHRLVPPHHRRSARRAGPDRVPAGRTWRQILEVDHRRLFLDVPAKGAKLDITMEARDREHAEEILRALDGAGYQPVRIAAGAALE